jgi:methionyl-tRNA formyltransferase
MEKIPYVFFGSPPIGPIALEALRQAHYPPVAIVDDPQLTTEQQVAIIEESRAAFILVVGYGAILRRPLLDSVAGQALNIHPSMLPEYRGPAPVVQALLDGVKETGVSLMEIDTQMDHGPVIAQERLMLAGNETPEQLYRVLTQKGVELFMEHIEKYLQEEVEPLPQNHALASFTHFVKKDDGLLDLTLPAADLERQIRAYLGWPRSWVVFQDKRLIVDKAHIENGNLRFDQVQPENGKPMTMAAFCAGVRLKPAEVYAELGIG